MLHAVFQHASRWPTFSNLVDEPYITASTPLIITHTNMDTLQAIAWI